jgi:hypothetical protein
MSEPTNQPQGDKPETPAAQANNEKPEYKPDYEHDVYERESGDSDSSFQRFCDYQGNNRYGG